MNIEQASGRRYAAETILSVIGASNAWFDSRGALVTILDNLEDTASKRQAAFAAGIREVVREVRRDH
jgi:hypothetical protein